MGSYKPNLDDNNSPYYYGLDSTYKPKKSQQPKVERPEVELDFYGVPKLVKPAATPQAPGLPANYKETEAKAFVDARRARGEVPGLPANYKDTESIYFPTQQDGDGSGRSAPAPDGNGSTGTRTSPPPLTMENVNEYFASGNLKGKGYGLENPFSSTQLPATSANPYFQKDSDIKISRELPEDMYSDIPLNLTSNVFDAGSGVEYGKEFVQMPASGEIEWKRTAGSTPIVSPGSLKVTEPNEAAQEPEINKIPPKPRGGRQLQNWENKYERKVRAAEMAAEREKSELEQNFKPDLERRAAFLDDDLNSMEALRAVEGQQGIVMHKNQYYHVNPKAGEEGENDFKEITLKDRNTIMRGGEGAQKMRDSWVTGIIESTKKPDDEEDNK